MSASVCVCVSPLQAIAVVRYVHQSFNERTGLSRNVGGLPTVVVFCWHSSVLRHGDEKSNRSKMTGVLWPQLPTLPLREAVTSRRDVSLSSQRNIRGVRGGLASRRWEAGGLKESGSLAGTAGGHGATRSSEVWKGSQAPWPPHDTAQHKYTNVHTPRLTLPQLRGSCAVLCWAGLVSRDAHTLARWSARAHLHVTADTF